jgi:hypothetical protein
MRARNLKPGLFQNEILGNADPLLTILFEGLWCMADRAGRLEDKPLKICASVFPYRRKLKEKHVDDLLWWLDEHGFIARYQICEKTTVVSTHLYIEVLEFAKHQSPHKDERVSKIQPFSADLHRSRPVEQRKSHHKSTKAIALTPDSGLLTPDSGLLTPDSYRTVPNPEHAPGLPSEEGRDSGSSNGKAKESSAASPDWLAFQRLQATYPQRSGRLDWGRAEHFCHLLIERHGQTWESLEAAAQRYATYTRATEAERTQHVLMPGNFFNPSDLDKPWAQEWTPPASNGAQRYGRKTYADHEREAAERLATLPGDDPGPM